MEYTREITSLALEKRSSLGIKVRQPLRTLKIKSNESLDQGYLELIKSELNVKEIFFDETMDDVVWLDSAIDDELLAEGEIRELIRNIQDLRKEKGLVPQEKAAAFVVANTEGIIALEKMRDLVVSSCNLSSLEVSPGNTDVGDWFRVSIEK